MIKVTEYTEHEDGSATLQFDLSLEVREMLLVEGLRSLIDRAIEEGKEDASE